jgi:lysophospholipase L1-like esterase
MKALAWALAGLLACLGAVSAQEQDACLTAASVAHAEAALPRAAAAIDRDHRLVVVVAGTTSSLPPNPSGAGTGYPVRLEAALKSRLPGVAVKVINEAKPRQTAAEMAAAFKRILAEDKPDLVIWQTGTFDAIHGVDPEEYRSALEEGIDAVHSGQADVILMNMQYSPRTESMIAVSTYHDHMRWVAMQHEIPLFDRFAIMKEWSDLGTFDLYATTKDANTAERVHDCLGRLLADVVIEATKLAEPHAKEPH